MDHGPALLGVLLGAGLLLIVMGFRTMTNQKLEESARKRGFWPLNAVLILAAVAMYMFAAAE